MPSGALCGFGLQRSATALEEIGKRFVRLSVIHLLENVVNVLPKSAGRELALLRAPCVPFNLANFSVRLVKELPDLRRLAMNELSAEFDGAFTCWIDVG